MLNTANIYIDILNKLKEAGVDPELVSEVEALNAIVSGDETTEPPTVGLVDIVSELGDDVEDLDIDINGDDTTEPPTPGLKDRIADLETDINGDDTTEPPTPGLKDRVAELETTINGDSSVSPVIPPLLAGAGNVRLSTLWSNSDTTQEFSSGNITLSSGDYDYLIVIYKYSVSGGASGTIAPKGSDINLNIAHGKSSAGAVTFSRLITYSSGTTLTADDAYRAIASIAGEINNLYVIPSIILGVKIMSN